MLGHWIRLYDRSGDRILRDYSEAQAEPHAH